MKQFGVNQTSNFAHINLLTITDTHNCLYYDDESIEKIKNAEYDVCLLLGDITNSDICEILKIVPYEKIYDLLGNHDGLDRFEESKIRKLNGQVITVNNVRIAGLQGSHRYKMGDYGMYSHEETEEILKNGTKVLGKYKVAVLNL